MVTILRQNSRLLVAISLFVIAFLIPAIRAPNGEHLWGWQVAWVCFGSLVMDHNYIFIPGCLANLTFPLMVGWVIASQPGTAKSVGAWIQLVLVVLYAFIFFLCLMTYRAYPSIGCLLWLSAFVFLAVACKRSPSTRRPGACPVCGHDLQASKHKCPECGAVIKSHKSAV